jgi:hypothetical protein
MTTDPNTNKAFEIIRQLSEDKNGSWSELRRLVNEIDKEKTIAQSTIEFQRKEIEALKARDLAKDAADLRKRLDEMRNLADSYLTTIDAAMKCVETAISGVSRFKVDVDGSGAEFFRDADVKLRRWISEAKHAAAIEATSAADRAHAENLSELQRTTATMRAERNAAVRKQLDLEHAVRDLTSKLGAVKKSFDTNTEAVLAEARREVDRQAKKLEARAKTIEELEADLAAVRRACAEAEVRADRHFETLTAIRKCDSGKAGERIAHVVQQFNELFNTHTCTADNWHAEVLNKFMVLNERANRVDANAEANERARNLLGEIGAMYGMPYQWWVGCDAPGGIIRRRIESQAERIAEIQAASQREIERLTDVIHDLRNPTPSKE